MSGGVSGAGVVVEWLSPAGGGGPWWGSRPPAGMVCVVRRSPTLPHAPACSTIGAGRLNFRVRYGTGCFPSAMATGTVSDTGRRSPRVGVSCPCVQNNTVDASTSSHGPAPSSRGGVRGASLSAVWDRSAPRLAALPRPTHQPGGLPGALPARGWGILILKRASRLDAFSGYHFPTWPTSHAPGGTTGTPEVGPSRSSRTEDSPSQDSYARSG